MKIYLTKEGYNKLREKQEIELKNLEIIRQEKSIAWSSDGDGIHDNPIYHTFKDREAVQLINIQKTAQLLSDAIIVDCEKRNINEVAICSIIECEVTNLNSELAKQIFIEIVGYGESDINNNKISYDSPIGKALMGLKKDDIIEINLPIGRLLYKIIKFYKDWTEIKK
jgi:transcription elongation factor GreA